MVRALRRIVVATLLALLAPLLVAPASAPAATVDPVVRAVALDMRAGRVTRAEGFRLLRAWRASGAAQRRLARSGRTWRAEQVAHVRRTAWVLAAGGRLRGGRAQTAVLSAMATAITMQRAALPAHEDRVVIPGEPLVFKYYAGEGVHVQPLETIKEGYARAAYRDDQVGARRIADRMLELSVLRGTTRTWEYQFAFGGGAPGWTSAMGQGLAVEFYGRVAEAAPAELKGRYRRFAEQLVAAFARPPSLGGVGVRQGIGRWYLLYSFAPSQRILNGHLQVLINLDRYAKMSGSRAARTIVTWGVRGVLPMLPRFDTGTWSRYQPGQEADLGYHDFQTVQLQRLGTLTGIADFTEYGERFARYRVTPPVPRGTVRGLGPLVAPRDGWLDEAVVRFAVDKRSSEIVVVRDAAGQVVHAQRTGGARGFRTLRWDGRDRSGRHAPAGEYSVNVSARDIIGNVRTQRLAGRIRVVEDDAPPVIQAVATRALAGGRARVGVRAFDAASGRTTVTVALNGRLLARSAGPRAGLVTIDLGRPPRMLRGAVVMVIDSSGNRSFARLS